MAMSVVYTVVDGVMWQEDRGGTITQYVPDTLGSVVAEMDEAGQVTHTADYWPYGEVRAETGTKKSPFGFVGVLGYMKDFADALYVRARHLRTKLARWQTVDPLWPRYGEYIYANASPSNFVDMFGLQAERMLRERQWFSWTPWFNEIEDGSLGCRKPRPTNEWTDHIFWICAICLSRSNIESDAGDWGRTDKEMHYIAGCLARIRCGHICPNNVGSYKEASDAYLGGTVGQADAVATDDGWDFADDYINDLGRPFAINDVRFCAWAARKSYWNMRK